MAIIKNTYLSMLSGCNRTQTRGAQFCAVVAYYFETLSTIFTGMKLFSFARHFWRSSCNYTQTFFHGRTFDYETSFCNRSNFRLIEFCYQLLLKTGNGLSGGCLIIPIFALIYGHISPVIIN